MPRSSWTFVLGTLAALATGTAAHAAEAMIALRAGLECKSRIPIENPQVKTLLRFVGGASYSAPPATVARLTVYGFPLLDASITEDHAGEPGAKSHPIASLSYSAHVRGAAATVAQALGVTLQNPEKPVTWSEWTSRKPTVSVVSDNDGTSVIRCGWSDPALDNDDG